MSAQNSHGAPVRPEVRWQVAGGRVTITAKTRQKRDADIC
jgi:hypothetical protein